ncbi:hypothetical protein HDE_09018 [Halotydeus destructor]|nr:hypothetical protein HDE_09018 [Halotydeus destructor]
MADKRYLERKLNRKLAEEEAILLPQQLTIGQLFNYSAEPTSFIEDEDVKNSNLQSGRRRLGITKLIKNGEQLCYDFYIRDFVRYGRSYLDNYEFWGQEVYSIDFNTRLAKISAFSIHLHSDRVRFYGRQNGGLIFFNSLSEKTRKKKKSFVGAYVSYRKTTSKLLEPPYATKCFDYKLPRAESAAHCLEKCLIAKVIKDYNQYPHIFTVFAEDSWKNYTILDPRTLGDSATETKLGLKEMKQNCSIICRFQGCFTEHFDPHLMGSVESEEMELAFYMTGQPDVLVTATPQTELIDYVIMILSCTAFWFGFSPFCSLVSLDLIKKIRKFAFSSSKRRPTGRRVKPSRAHPWP